MFTQRHFVSIKITRWRHTVLVLELTSGKFQAMKDFSSRTWGQRHINKVHVAIETQFRYYTATNRKDVQVTGSPSNFLFQILNR
jgi:hypothetical protein